MLTFDEWMQEVDSLMLHATGFDSEDFADYAYHDSYVAGETPEYVTDTVLDIEGWE